MGEERSDKGLIHHQPRHLGIPLLSPGLPFQADLRRSPPGDLASPTADHPSRPSCLHSTSRRILAVIDNMADDEERRKAAREKRKQAGSGETTRENAKEQLQNGVTAAKDTVNKAGEFVTPVLDGVMDAIGGVSPSSQRWLHLS